MIFRFSSESNRNRHIARAHRNRRISTDSPSLESTVDSSKTSQVTENANLEAQASSSSSEGTSEHPVVRKKSDRIRVDEPQPEKRSRVKVDMFEKIDGLSEEDSIKAKAVAALRALNSRDRRTRNGFSGNNGPVLWTGVSRNKTRGNNSEERFRFPRARKTPPPENRFASLVEKKKKRGNEGVTKGKTKENIEEVREATPPLSVPVSLSLDVYDFQEDAEQTKPLGGYGTRGGVPGKPESSDQQDEVSVRDGMEVATNDAVEPVIHSSANTVGETMDEVSQSSQEIVVPASKPQCRVKKRLFVKKKRWHRIIVDSGEETSDAETSAELKRKEDRGIKRRHSVPSGVLVEDRQHSKKTKTKQPSRGSPKRSTKTDLLMSVFAKSRQRSNITSATRPAPLFNRSYKTYESESDSSSINMGNVGASSEDEGKRPSSRRKKTSAL